MNHCKFSFSLHHLIILAGLFMLVSVSSCQSGKQHAVKNQSFHPGKIWRDTDGVHINAHGGGILYYNDIYYWFGEFKTAGRMGNSAQVGVSCYASSDLYNWKNEGIALKVSEEA